MMPLTILQMYCCLHPKNETLGKYAFMLSWSAGISIFPLLYCDKEYVLKCFLFQLYHLGYFLWIRRNSRTPWTAFFTQVEKFLLFSSYLVSTLTIPLWPLIQAIHGQGTKYDFFGFCLFYSVGPPFDF